MPEVKTSQEVGYTSQGRSGEQCRDCGNYIPLEDSYGICFDHRVAASGHCNYFKAK